MVGNTSNSSKSTGSRFGMKAGNQKSSLPLSNHSSNLMRNIPWQ